MKRSTITLQNFTDKSDRGLTQTLTYQNSQQALQQGTFLPITFLGISPHHP
ncbi:hypothetical protein [Tychonema sp. LEGE 07203]|uniref:hypothetical protein n=1 Tax=Tychonema sp. LEGE 07203 TaxID=1828671 RepID=UPI00188072D9|nr:hypothetical protein [Tychonema sp. LEGE 07203]MBE9094852.1 hypothetical protein [Tychonema sp. LEGE 07203]